MDVYVNGQVAVNGGVPMALRARSLDSGYLYLPPGLTVSPWCLPARASTTPFLGPLDVHGRRRPSLHARRAGTKARSEHNGLVIDETAAYQASARSRPTAALAHITVNNLKGAPSIHFSLGGVAELGAAAYGDFEAGLWPAWAQSSMS